VTLTYTDNRARPYGDAAAREEPFVPVYARTRSRKARSAGVRSWMILAPVGVLVLGGAAAMMLMDGGREAPALVEPAATAPVLPATPTVLTPAIPAAPLEAAPSPRTSAPAASAQRGAPAPRELQGESATAPAERAVESSRTTITLNTAPTAVETPPPPRIVVEPLD